MTETPDVLEDSFFVATDGSDAAEGTRAAPFATIQRAIAAMRSSSYGRTYVRGGTYFLAGQTLTLGAEDHGIELINYPGEQPVISGGFPVHGWVLDDAERGIWSAALPDDLVGIGSVTVNGEWYDSARTPNRDASNSQARSSWFIVERSLGPPVANSWDPSFWADRAFVYRGNDLEPEMAINDQPDAAITIWDKFGWSADNLQIESVDHSAREVKLKSGSRFGLDPGSRYYVHGIRSGLDAHGEYYNDVAARRLLLIPKHGVDPNTELVAVSGVAGSALMQIEGADNVHISGFDVRDHAGHGMRIAQGTNVLIEHSRFYSLGIGLAIAEQTSGIMIKKNEIFDIAGTAVLLDGSSNTLLANSIHDVGLVEQAAQGVTAGPGRNVIAHNHITNVPHYGIMSGNDAADGLIIEYNILENINQGTNDAGVIYLKNNESFNPDAREQVRYNRIVGSGGLHVDPVTTDFAISTFTFAIYLDNGQSGTDVYGNVIIGASYGAVFPHNGHSNDIRNNLFISAEHSQLYLETSYPQGNVFEKNVFYSTNLTPTIFTKYHGQEHVIRNNLFYNAAQPGYFSSSFFTWEDGQQLDFDASSAAGFHTGSLIADPMFVSPNTGDYQLQPGSPAYALGFEDLPFDLIGPDAIP